MSFLEYLGLEYLFRRDIAESSASIEGILGVIGFLLWILMEIFRPELCRYGVVVFNLLIVPILLFMIIVKFIRTFKNSQKKKMCIFFLIASIIFLSCYFIKGMNSTYHSLVYNYDYVGIFSGIASLLWPIVIINFLFPFFCQSEKVGEKIKFAFGSLGTLIVVFLICLFIGQTCTVIFSFAKSDFMENPFYLRFAVYHDAEITEKRKTWEYTDTKDLISKNIQSDIVKMLDEYKNTNQMQVIKNNDTPEEFEKKVKSYVYGNFPNETIKEYGVRYLNYKIENDNIIIYKLMDMEYKTIYYSRVSLDDYHFIDFVDEDYYNSVIVK